MVAFTQLELYDDDSDWTTDVVVNYHMKKDGARYDTRNNNNKCGTKMLSHHINPGDVVVIVGREKEDSSSESQEKTAAKANSAETNACLSALNIKSTGKEPPPPLPADDADILFD